MQPWQGGSGGSPYVAAYTRLAESGSSVAVTPRAWCETAAEGWTEYSDDRERTLRALTAPGVTTLVAIADEQLVGAIQVQSDGVIQAHVSMLLTAPSSRGLGVGSALLAQGLKRAGGQQLDIRTRTEGYYERLGASRSLGFRLTRADLGLTNPPDAT